MTFDELLKRYRPEYKPPELLLAIDPGETTGYATFVKGKYFHSGIIQFSATYDWQLLFATTPDIVVCEEYRIYGGQRLAHTGSKVETVRIIGVIEYMCRQYYIPIHMQMASSHKNFCTDDKLKEWNFYKGINKHARDAIRIGCYWLLFHKDDNK